MSVRTTGWSTICRTIDEREGDGASDLSRTEITFEIGRISD
jgi:hypothetical protein